MTDTRLVHHQPANKTMELVSGFYGVFVTVVFYVVGALVTLLFLMLLLNEAFRYQVGYPILGFEGYEIKLFIVFAFVYLFFILSFGIIAILISIRENLRAQTEILVSVAKNTQAGSASNKVRSDVDPLMSDRFKSADDIFRL